ncbi:MAG: hypothetical protein KDC99_18810 [Cyclobacteriaceae bacterium]|nr:hypothetical protein [Cyclobacteriaceae bacterium]
MNKDESFRVRWWVQEEIDSGYWQVSGVVSLKSAMKYVDSGFYEEAHIVLDEEGWPIYEIEGTDDD